VSIGADATHRLQSSLNLAEQLAASVILDGPAAALPAPLAPLRLQVPLPPCQLGTLHLREAPSDVPLQRVCTSPRTRGPSV
jgi:hypothetical protein